MLLWRLLWAAESSLLVPVVFGATAAGLVTTAAIASRLGRSGGRLHLARRRADERGLRIRTGRRAVHRRGLPVAPEDEGHSFGKDAINTLLKYMEDYHDRLVVIVNDDDMRRAIGAALATN